MPEIITTLTRSLSDGGEESFRPMRDLILVDPDPDNKTESGLHIVSGAKAQTGTIKAVGPGKYDKRGNLIPLSVAPGDRIKFEPRTYNQYGKYLIIQEADIACVLEESTD